MCTVSIFPPNLDSMFWRLYSGVIALLFYGLMVQIEQPIWVCVTVCVCVCCVLVCVFPLYIVRCCLFVCLFGFLCVYTFCTLYSCMYVDSCALYFLVFPFSFCFLFVFSPFLLCDVSVSNAFLWFVCAVFSFVFVNAWVGVFSEVFVFTFPLVYACAIVQVYVCCALFLGSPAQSKKV